VVIRAHFLFFSLLLLKPVLSLAQWVAPLSLQPLPADLRQHFAAAGIPDSAVGIALISIPAAPTSLLTRVQGGQGPQGPQGFGFNAQAPLNPASTIKLVTTRAALGLLGADYRHQTRIATTGRLVGSTLEGDVFFQGGGDPKLVVEDLKEIAERLRAMGISRIEGRLVVDGTRFNEPEIDSGQFDQQPNKPYNVGPHAAMVNFKAVKISVWPEAAKRVRFKTEPRFPESAVKTRVALVDGGCAASQVTARMGTEAKLLISGVLGRRCAGVDFYVSVMDHAQFAFTAFQGAWEEAGGSMKVKLQSGVTPAYARTLVQWESPRPLIELLADINKMSNNPMTRQLFLNLSASDAAPATREASAKVVNTYLASRGLVFPEMVLDNGSGLSRDERISALSLVRLLVDAFQSSDGPAWVATLPALGFEGTVRNRLRNSEISGQAFLKTGSLENVRSVAGYVRTASGEWVAVAVIVNHADAGRSRSAMDEVIKWVYASL
jgi:D-alanyl-D-alanine carboxypeptidase/D-alanyl-D-alanine-endopeptidase (penicillin-binding protein 4)